MVEICSHRAAYQHNRQKHCVSEEVLVSICPRITKRSSHLKKNDWAGFLKIVEVSFNAYPKQCVSNTLRAPSVERKGAKDRRKINKPNAWAVPLASTDVRFAANNADGLTCFSACSHAQEGVRSLRAADSMCSKCPPVGLHDSLAALLYRCALSV